VGQEFDNMVKQFQRELIAVHGRKPAYQEVTDGITNFLKEEGIDERMLRRAKDRFRRGLF
jgi:hypothetical protein